MPNFVQLEKICQDTTQSTQKFQWHTLLLLFNLHTL